MDAPTWTVSELWVHPIKSCKGIALREGIVTTYGLEHDREYMVVDAKTGMFVAQRGDSGLGIGVKSMSQVTPKIESGNMALSAPGMSDIDFEMFSWLDMLGVRDNEANLREVQVWRTKCQAVIMPDHVNNWFTEFLSLERPGDYQLVCFRPEAIRRAKVGYSQLLFADGYPFLVISQESLEDLNRRIGGSEPLLMNRFRPTIVIQGGLPYDEDLLHRMVINGVDFEGMELCVRCPITTQDQETTERHKEPLRTLATYRRNPIAGKGGVVFGRNYNHLSTGRITVGDRVDLLSGKSGPFGQ